ncbi:MAG: apolipoprotein N-acyltransferase [Flavobacterium sp.]|nr:apolipoprotein N-acyltransferase [Flavobacterium sp.]
MSDWTIDMSEWATHPFFNTLVLPTNNYKLKRLFQFVKKNTKYQSLSIALLSGIITAFASINMWYFLACVSIVPLFIFLSKESRKANFFNGLAFGIGIGLGLFFWMIKGVGHYTGDSFWFGILIFAFSCLLLGLYFGVLLRVTQLFWLSKSDSPFKLIINRLSIAALWTLSEFALTNILQAFPLHLFRFGFSFCANIYILQLASFGGLSLLTFFTVLLNLVFAEYFLQKKSIYLIVNSCIIAVLFAFGAVAYSTYQPDFVGKPFKVAVVSDNTNPETKWNNNNGNALADNYFKLCEEAVALQPDFIIWPESALPWTYSPDDDLLKELIKISSGSKLTHVIGINTENAADKKCYNSVYYIDSKNKVSAIYNKQILLKGLEEPIGNVVVPFAYKEGFVFANGVDQKPIPTRFGKAATLICNEIGIENSAAEQVRSGANFLFNTSNDSWFKDTYVSEQHLYYARLMAVENRKDCSIANNCGYNTIINSKGDFVEQKKETKGTVLSGMIYPNSNTTLFSQLPYLFPLLLMLFLMISTFYWFVIKPEQP